jgi:hypothetical protein
MELSQALLISSSSLCHATSSNSKELGNFDARHL